MPFCCCNYDLEGNANSWTPRDTVEECWAAGDCGNPDQNPNWPVEFCDEDFCNGEYGGGWPTVACCTSPAPDVFECLSGDLGSPFGHPNACRQQLYFGGPHGRPRCPNDCQDEAGPDCDTVFEGPPGPCCIFAPGQDICIEAHRSPCENAGGNFYGDFFDTCQEFYNQGNDCLQLGSCRFQRPAFYLPGDKQHTTQLCETAVLHFTHRPAQHWDITSEQQGDNPGDSHRLELVTSHDAIACANQLLAPDPCERHYGFLVKEPDGYLYPAFWSEPDVTENNSVVGRFNLGVFTKQNCPDPQQLTEEPNTCELGSINEPERIDRVPVGYVHARAGVEKRQWAEAAFYTDVERCGIYR